MATPEYLAPLSGLDSVFEKFLRRFITKELEINIADALKLFGRLSNPESLQKVNYCLVTT